MGFRHDLYPFHPPKQGWAKTVNELRTVAGKYAEPLIRADTWTCVAAWLQYGVAWENLPEPKQKQVRAVVAMNVRDMKKLRHPNVREPWFDGHAAHRLAGNELLDREKLADEALLAWKEQGGTIRGHMIRGAHQSALYEMALEQEGLAA